MSMSKPKNSKEVCDIMTEYCKQKKFNFTELELDYMAEDCYLCFEGRGWKGVSYWPAVAKRWVLNNVSKQRPVDVKKRPVETPPVGKTVRDKILERRQQLD